MGKVIRFPKSLLVDKTKVQEALNIYAISKQQNPYNLPLDVLKATSKVEGEDDAWFLNEAEKEKFLDVAKEMDRIEKEDGGTIGYVDLI